MAEKSETVPDPFREKRRAPHSGKGKIRRRDGEPPQPLERQMAAFMDDHRSQHRMGHGVADDSVGAF